MRDLFQKKRRDQEGREKRSERKQIAMADAKRCGGRPTSFFICYNLSKRINQSMSTIRSVKSITLAQSILSFRSFIECSPPCWAVTTSGFSD